MDDQQFGRLTRQLADVVNRRRIMRSLAAGALAEVGLAGLATRVEAKSKSKASDPGVRFFEQLAAALSQETGDCDALTQAALAFQTAHQAAFDTIKAQEAQWDAKKRTQVAKKYEARITQAAESLHALAASCRFRGTSETTICGVDSSPSPDKFPPVGAAQCGPGCDCGCICPISGWECAGAFFGCVGGSEASCCWFGACAGNQCQAQCPNCCNCNVNCCC